MKSQPNRDYVSNDDVQTPQALADAIVKHFKPHKLCYEPCRGGGSFFNAMKRHPDVHSEFVGWSEIKEGRDFLNPNLFIYRQNWIITNPPWSLIRPFLQRSMQVADNIVFLLTINHVWTKARIRDTREAGFGIKEILLCDMPKEFPQSGFQLGAVHWQRGWGGDIKLSNLTT